MKLRNMMFALPCLSLLGCSSSASVGDEPAPLDVAGSYTISLTYQENGCELENWQEDETLSGVALEVSQEDTAVVGTVEGVTGGVLALIHGSNVYEGTVSGQRVEMTIYGEYPLKEGNCSYSLNNVFVGDWDGDFISGTLKFTTQTNGNSDCEPVECSSNIAFTGSRPPKSGGEE